MNDSELPDEVRGLIASSVPNLDALEVLIFLAGHSAQAWTADALVHAIRPVKETEMRQYLNLFGDQRLLEASPSGGYRFRPATPSLESAVAALCRAYNERPVTLIRTVYSIADARKLQAFADAFRLKKEP